MIELSRSQTLLQDRRTVWLVASLTILLFAIANLPWHLDDYDQAKQAFTSFQMVNLGTANPSRGGEVRWFYQQTPHQRVATKPPLVAWISANIFAITRSWELAWRLPSFLSAVAIAIVLFRAADSAYGPIAALIALSAFGLNLLTPRLATLVRTDMPLTLVIFLIGLLIWEKIRRPTQWRPRDRIYLFALLTAAMLIKGPIVYAFLLPGMAVFEWRRRQNVSVAGRVECDEPRTEPPGPLSLAYGATGTARRLQDVWSAWWPWIVSLAIFLLWTIGGILLQPGFFNDVVMREFGGRFGKMIHRPQPFYFYVTHLVHKFFPWSVLMITIAIFDFRSRNWRLRSAFREMPPTPKRGEGGSPETFWLLCWSIGGLILMSLIPSKRVDRIFPVVPPLCLLLAAEIGKLGSCSHGSVSGLPTSVDSDSTGHPPSPGFGEAGRSVATQNAETHAYRWSAIAVLVAILGTCGYTISKVTTGYIDHRDALAVFGRDIRHEAELHHWRYEVVSPLDEGMLLYLRKTRFIEPKDAVAEWNRGDLDALVASADKAAALMPGLQGALLSDLKSTAQKSDPEKAYVLITR